MDQVNRGRGEYSDFEKLNCSETDLSGHSCARRLNCIKPIRALSFWKNRLTPY